MITVTARTANAVKALLELGMSNRQIGRQIRIPHCYVTYIRHGRYRITGNKEPVIPVEKPKENIFNYKQFRCWITGCGV